VFFNIKVLVENKTYKNECYAEHGLSLYIHAGGKRILFDTGSSDLFMYNANKMGVDIRGIDFTVVSHGHYDHTGGIPAFYSISEDAPVYIHHSAFKKTYSQIAGKELSKKHCGIMWDRKQFDDRLILTDGIIWIDQNTVISGSIPPSEGFEPDMRFYEKDDSGGLVLDKMEHEQFLAIRGKDGVYLVCGCCHLGVLAALEYARCIFEGEPIRALIAGMHLVHTPVEQIDELIDKMIAFGVRTVVPLHCTGLEAISRLKTRLKENCILLSTGDSFGW
jgi:7,8-dihydropterin-6-yl-methyl-4-(beta-D-ribofuranosyl)aminobenzene 5'-phosphate synthase